MYLVILTPLPAASFAWFAPGNLQSISGIRSLRSVHLSLSSDATYDPDRKDFDLQEQHGEEPFERVLLREEGTAMGAGWDTMMEEDARALLDAAGLDDDEQLSLTLCDDPYIQKLNREWRKIDKPTDVLSFPMDDDQLLGDLVISLDTAQRQAEERQHAARDELRVLMVHGILHLLGYDHETTREEYDDMRAAERKLLNRLGWVGQGLIAYAEEDS